MNLKLIIGVSALLFPLLTMQTVLEIMPHPRLEANASPERAEQFFDEWYGVQQAQTLFHILGIIWFGVFALGLSQLARAAEPAPHFWSRLISWSATGIVAVKVAVMAMVSGAIGLFVSPDTTANGGIVLSIYYAGWYAHVLIVYFLPFFWTAVAFVSLKYGALPAWIGWFSLVGVLASLVGTVSVVSRDIGWFPYPVFGLLLVWSLATGIYCLATARSTAVTPPMATAA